MKSFQNLHLDLSKILSVLEYLKIAIHSRATSEEKRPAILLESDQVSPPVHFGFLLDAGSFLPAASYSSFLFLHKILINNLRVPLDPVLKVMPMIPHPLAVHKEAPLKKPDLSKACVSLSPPGQHQTHQCRSQDLLQAVSLTLLSVPEKHNISDKHIQSGPGFPYLPILFQSFHREIRTAFHFLHILLSF